MSRVPLAITIVLDCGNATGLAEFWSAALEGCTSTFHAADLDAEMARLIALGARKLQDAPNCLGTYCWFLMADPDGNEFCLAPSG